MSFLPENTECFTPSLGGAQKHLVETNFHPALTYLRVQNCLLVYQSFLLISNQWLGALQQVNVIHFIYILYNDDRASGARLWV